MANEQTLREYLKRVTADLHRTRRRVEELQSGALEPIAIVGMACPAARRHRLAGAALGDGGRGPGHDLRVPRGPGLGHRVPARSQR
nr:polyketide synthase docking domain-containing protein [Actinomadura madurae]